jgi:hypothetical protein
MRTLFISWVFELVVASSCTGNDSSSGTEHAGRDLRTAQSAVSDKSKALITTELDIDRRKRELVKNQQDLVDQQRLLEGNRQQLGSARGTLGEARTAYGAAVTERFARLDAALAGLATRTDATSTDAAAGLRARRDLLSTKLGSMPSTADPDWIGYTRDVDVTFDAIERDLGAVKR